VNERAQKWREEMRKVDLWMRLSQTRSEEEELAHTRSLHIMCVSVLFFWKKSDEMRDACWKFPQASGLTASSEAELMDDRLVCSCEQTCLFFFVHQKKRTNLGSLTCLWQICDDDQIVFTKLSSGNDGGSHDP
jgi:hypothetical protein